jgi:hypothetical protein
MYDSSSKWNLTELNIYCLKQKANRRPKYHGLMFMPMLALGVRVRIVRAVWVADGI